MSHSNDNQGSGSGGVKKFFGGIKDGAQNVIAKISDLTNPRCNFPGCTKQCYVENGYVHDYCGRTHAQEHKRMIEETARQRRSQKRGGGNGNHGSGQGYVLGSNTSGSSEWSNWSSYQQRQGFSQDGYGYSPWNSDGPIYFYNRDEPYYEFTNFYNGAPIMLDDKEWKTAEHYFQAQKFVGTPYVEVIRKALGPRDAFNLSRDPSISHWRRSDWEEVKMDIMRKALFAKFAVSGSKPNHLKDRLLGTGSRELVERSPYDSFWGDGGDGSGENHLGKLLMELRSKLRGEDVERDSCKSSQPASYETRSSGSAASGLVASGIPSSELTRPPIRPDKQKIDSEPKTAMLIDVDDNSKEHEFEPSSSPATDQEHPQPPPHTLPTPLTPTPAKPQDKPDEPEPMDQN